MELHFKAEFCNKICRKKKYDHDKSLQTHLKYPNGSDYVECKICSFRGKDLTQHLILSHKMPVYQYKTDFNTKTIISEDRRNSLAEKVAGSNNPGYKHGGKLSPYSKNFTSYNGMSDEEKKKKISKIASGARVTATENNNNPLSVEYYIKRGATKEEAEQALKNRQSNFSLDKCIKDHGETEGIKVFEARQIKWLKSLYDGKTEKEIEQFHASKSNGGKRCYYAGPIFLKDPHKAKTPAIVYYLKCFNEEKVFWKVGITTRDINDRFEPIALFRLKYKLEREDRVIFRGNLFDCYKIEQELLNQFSDKRIKIDYNGFSTYEAFSEDVLSEEVLNTLLTTYKTATLEDFFV